MPKSSKFKRDILKLSICLILFIFSFYIYYTTGVPGSSILFHEKKIIIIVRHITLAVVGLYIGTLLTLVIKNDIKRIQAIVLLVLSIFMINLYFNELFEYSNVLLSYFVTLLLSACVGFIVTYKIHPKEGVCKFTGIRYKKQQRVVTFAAIIPAIYITASTLLIAYGQVAYNQMYWNNTLVNYLTVMAIAWLAGVVGLYYFIKIDVGSKSLAILGHTRTGKTILMSAMLGFMTDSKYRNDYRGVDIISNRAINEYLDVREEDISEILWSNYYNELRDGYGWGRGTEEGSLTTIGAKIRILPGLYSCITLRLFDYPGSQFEIIVQLLEDEKIRKLIPTSFDMQQIKRFTNKIKRKLEEKYDEKTIKEVAVILTLIRSSEKLFYLLDGHKFIRDIIEASKLKITNDNVKRLLIKSAPERGRPIQSEYIDYRKLRQAISSSFDKEVYLVFTKADIICTIADYCEDPDIKNFKDQFEFGNYDKAKEILLYRILTKYGVIGYRDVEDLKDVFVVVGVMSKIKEEEDIKPRGGNSCDDFVRVEGFMEVIKY